MSKTVADFVGVSGRFARSVRLDAGSAQLIEGYRPTARALEIIRRVAYGMASDSGTRAFSIIGPYGSGKSSFAVFLDTLLGPKQERQAAEELLSRTDNGIAADVVRARREWKVATKGMVRAVITAPQREPITTTVLRALHRGALRFGLHKDARALSKLVERATDPDARTPSHDEVLDSVTRLVNAAPVLLVVDEFGKNLEAYARAEHDADLYLLQQLAEAAAAPKAPLIVITIQHMAFEAYAEAASAAQRREWAKVQGRFEDIPFIDTAATARALIASALTHGRSGKFADAVAQVAGKFAEEARRLGLPAASSDLISDCYPLHPTVLTVLPDLCARFGQNERTLFSFLASGEPLSLKGLIATLNADDMPWLRLDALYDYFVESASTLVGTSRDATRWVEVSSAVRDAQGINLAERRALKTLGVLNLVSASGNVRASPDLIEFSLVGSPSFPDRRAVGEALKSLAKRGIVVHRDFADEYRIWRGSDFDLADALSEARARARNSRLVELLDVTYPPPPAVAARHSVRTLTVRSFVQTWCDGTGTPTSKWDGFAKPGYHDGFVALVTDESLFVDDVPTDQFGAFPVVAAFPQDVTGLRDAAIEVAALGDVLRDDRLPEEDLAVRKEIHERIDYAYQVLTSAVAETYATADWIWLNAHGSRPEPLEASRTSRMLSYVLDRAFCDSPRVVYEAVNRHELTSQGARIRTALLNSILVQREKLESNGGFDEGSAEESAFHALLVATGAINNSDPASPTWALDLSSGQVTLAGGTDRAWRKAWTRVRRVLDNAARTITTDLLDELAKPPLGLRPGVATVMMAASLVRHPERYALFEHDTFVRSIDAGILERFGRNPHDFRISHYQEDASPKLQRALREIDKALDLWVRSGQPVLAKVSEHITASSIALRIAQVLAHRRDTYTETSREFWSQWAPDRLAPERAARAARLRDYLLVARDPEQLVYESVPKALGWDAPLNAARNTRGSPSTNDLPELADRLVDALTLIEAAADQLARHVMDVLLASTGRERFREVVDDAFVVDGVQTAPQSVKTLVTHLTAARNDVFDQIAGRQQPAVKSWANGLAASLTSKPLTAWRDGDVANLTERIALIATEFRNIRELAEVNQRREDGNSAFALALTGQGATEPFRRIVELPNSDLAAKANAALGSAVAALVDDFGGENEALGGLLAAAAERLMSQGSTTMTNIDDAYEVCDG
jgi:hypothetical protein